MTRQNARLTTRNSRQRTYEIQCCIAANMSNAEIMELYGISYAGLQRIKASMQ